MLKSDNLKSKKLYPYHQAFPDDSQNCVSLEHVTITTSKSLNLNNPPWLPIHSKTQYVGNPFLYLIMQSRPIRLLPPNSSETRSQTSTIFGNILFSFTIIIFLPPLAFSCLNHCWSCNRLTLFSEGRTRRRIISKSCPTHPCPPK